MANTTPSGAEKNRESTEPESSQTAKMFFFLLLLLSSDGLAHCCVNLSRWFTHETAAFYIEQCTILSLFRNFEVSQDACSHPLDNSGFVRWDAIFIKYMCMRQNGHVATNFAAVDGSELTLRISCSSSRVLFSVLLRVVVFSVVRRVPSYFAGEPPWSLRRTISCI